MSATASQVPANNSRHWSGWLALAYLALFLAAVLLADWLPLGFGPNDLDLDLGERVRVCFVMGPNMAGKSTP